jgi:hypothetical protein
MPAFAADYFGSQNVGPIYGLMLTAWGVASAVSPLLIAYMRESTGSYGRASRNSRCHVRFSARSTTVSRPKDGSSREVKLIDVRQRRSILCGSTRSEKKVSTD